MNQININQENLETMIPKILSNLEEESSFPIKDLFFRATDIRTYKILRVIIEYFERDNFTIFNSFSPDRDVSLYSEKCLYIFTANFEDEPINNILRLSVVKYKI